jgi:hypothetical protein
LVKVVWNLTEPLPKRKANKEATVKPIGKEQLNEIGKILVVAWGGFIQTPVVLEKHLKPRNGR